MLAVIAWPPGCSVCSGPSGGWAVVVLYLPPPEGESETRRRAQRLKPQPVRAGRRPPRSGALEKASTSPTLNRPTGLLFDGQALDKAVLARRLEPGDRAGRAGPPSASRQAGLSGGRCRRPPHVRSRSRRLERVRACGRLGTLQCSYQAIAQAS